MAMYWYGRRTFPATGTGTSDDGSFTDMDFEDSLWKQDPAEVIDQLRERGATDWIVQHAQARNVFRLRKGGTALRFPRADGALPVQARPKGSTIKTERPLLGRSVS